MFLSHPMRLEDNMIAKRQEGTNSLHIKSGDRDDLFISIDGATPEEVCAMAAAINAPIERMKREREMSPAQATMAESAA